LKLRTVYGHFPTRADLVRTLTGRAVDEIAGVLTEVNASVFGRHLPAGILSQVAYAAVFSIADNDLSNGSLDAKAATITSLLILGVPRARADALVGDRRAQYRRRDGVTDAFVGAVGPVSRTGTRK
jgi:hypothetical protein